MAFLAPLFLGLGALVSVPILVHFLRRRLQHIVDFPAVLYLTRMQREHSKELLLRHRLLLILRVLAVLALALAAARPMARLAGLGHAPVALVLVVDNSLSTSAVVNGKPVLDALKQDSKALLSAMAADDRAWLVTADGRVAGGSPSSLQSTVDQMHSLAGHGDLSAAVRRAVALARGGKPRAPVVAIITDGQVQALGASNDSVIVVGEIPVVLFAPRRALPRNRAVIDVALEPPRWAPTGVVSATIMSVDSTPWRITLNGRTQARGVVAPGLVPNDSSRPGSISARLSSGTDGWLRGSVELDADEMRADDIRHFAVHVSPPPLVDIRVEGGPFLAAALSTLIDDGRIARTGVPSAGGLPTAGTTRITVSGAEASALSPPLLLVAPSDPLRIGDANRTLARLNIPWRFGGVLRDTVLTRRPNAMASASANTTANTIANTITEGTLEGARVMLRYPLLRDTATLRKDSAASVRSDTLAMAAGTPWAVSGSGYVLLGSPIVPGATDLPLRPGFLPWLFGVVAIRLGDDGRLFSAVPGARVTLPADITGLEMPDGSVRGDLAHSGVAPEQSGVYLLRRDAARVGALVVNAEPEESNLVQATEKSLLDRISGRAVSIEKDARQWRAGVLDQAAGRSFMLPLVALALIALLLEAWFARLSATAVRRQTSAIPAAPRSRAA